VSAWPPHMPGMTIGELRKTLSDPLASGDQRVVIEAAGRSLSLYGTAVAFRNGFFVFVLKAGKRPGTAADLREAVVFAMQAGGAYGQNLHESKQVIAEIPDGRMFSLAAAAVKHGNVVLTAGAGWPPEEFR
jgi:hypothetical protein